MSKIARRNLLSYVKCDLDIPVKIFTNGGERMIIISKNHGKKIPPNLREILDDTIRITDNGTDIILTWSFEEKYKKLEKSIESLEQKRTELRRAVGYKKQQAKLEADGRYIRRKSEKKHLQKVVSVLEDRIESLNELSDKKRDEFYEKFIVIRKSDKLITDIELIKLNTNSPGLTYEQVIVRAISAMKRGLF